MLHLNHRPIKKVEKKSIMFILPHFSNKPVGGYKVIFEYANKLVNDNYEVGILFINQNPMAKYPLPKVIKRKVVQIRTNFGPIWFNLNKNIKCFSSTQKQLSINNPDIVVATDSSTIGFTNSKFKNSKKLYFIQGYETWNMSKNALYKTYNMDYKKIVISKWLEKVVSAHSLEAPIYIRNFINTNEYKVINPIKNRNKYTIGMLYSEYPIKGSKYIIRALRKIKKYIPQLHVIMFGTAKRPKNLPSWFEYVQNASQKDTIRTYNRISIFVSGSLEEGFGLTGLEAMACGAALISNNYSAVHEYADNGTNALLINIKNENEIIDSIVSLIKNDDLRKKIAITGSKESKKYTIDYSYAKLKHVLEGLD